MNILNGCAWKGGKLQISLAKANKFNTLEDGRIVFIKAEGEERCKSNRRISPKKKRKLVRHASDQSLVTDKNVDKRKGWRRGRYGRAIATLRIRRPNRQMLIIDPSHYKNNLEKLFGSIKPKPLAHLTWTITDIANESEDGSVYSAEISEEDNVADEEETVTEAVAEEEMPVPVVTEVVESSNNPIENTSTDAVEEVLDAYSPMEVETVVFEESNTPSEDPIINESIIETEPIETNPSSQLVKQPVKEAQFEVNVNWSSLFTSNHPASSNVSNSSSNTGFSLTSLLEKSKIKNVSMDELFKKTTTVDTPVTNDVNKSIESLEQSETNLVKKVYNYAHLFGDLNRITPTTATRFGMLLSRKEDMLQEWRVERIELKEDFKKRLAEGKRRNRRGNKLQ